MIKTATALAIVLALGGSASATWKPHSWDCGGGTIVETGDMRHSDPPKVFTLCFMTDDADKIAIPAFR